MNKGCRLFSFYQRILLLLVMSFCGSCYNDPTRYNGGNIGEEGTPVMVNLTLDKDILNTPSDAINNTRSELASGDSTFTVRLGEDMLVGGETATRATSKNTPLYNLWVFQFGSDKRVRKITRVDDSSEPIKETMDINVELFTGVNQTIYLLALGKQYPNPDFSDVVEISDLEGLKFDFYRFNEGVAIAHITTQEDIPYAGYQSKLEIIKTDNSGSGYIKSDPTTGFTGSIKMKALVTKVTFDFAYTASGFTPSFITLNNIPTHFAINTIPTSFTSAISIDLTTADLTNGKRVEYSWYMPANPQGKVPAITKESERFFYTTNMGNTKGSAPRDATFLNLWALDNKLADNYALYYIFLGSNNTDDFNLFPNSHYAYRTDINTAINDNNRVLSKKIAKTIDVSCSGVVKYFNLGNRNHVNYDFDAHPGMRPMEITALRGSVKVEVLNSSDGGKTFTTPSFNSSWLKLSTYSNYTDALRAYRAGSSSGLSTSIMLNAAIPGLFKLYIYNDEYEKYTTDDPNTPALKRSMYIRVTYNTGIGAPEEYIIRMDQRPAYYIGLFGGESRSANDGSYSKGLAFESLREPRQYLSYYKGSYDFVRGTYNAPCASLNNYDVENAVCGRKATIALSENKANLPFWSNQNIKEPRWMGGDPDLYQYKYYTNDSFGVRACYDKNRDSNGNGKIDDHEMIWYLPAYFQNLAVNYNYHSEKHGVLSSPDLFYITSINLEFGRYSTTMFCDGKPYFNGYYTLYHHMPVMRSGIDNFSAKSHERCVRDVSLPVSESFPTGPIVSVEKEYAVIDATGFMQGSYEDRVTSRLRSDNRLVRHLITDDIGQKVSGRFRVANADLSRQMTWSEAGGFDSTLDDKPLGENVNPTDAKNTGCAQLPVEGGLSPWRLPTAMELVLIDMMDEIMANTFPITGYTRLYDQPGANNFYWSATEYDKACAYILLNANNPDQKRAARYLKGDVLTLKKAGYNTVLGRVRCIQDLHY